MLNCSTKSYGNNSQLKVILNTLKPMEIQFRG